MKFKMADSRHIEKHRYCLIDAVFDMCK